MKPYISIDIETTGLDPSECQILEFGAVIEDGLTSVEALPRFHAYVFHNQIVGEPYALAMNAAILKKIANVRDQMNDILPGDMPEVFVDGERYLRPRILGRRFSEFLTAHCINPKEVVPAGKNFGSFDRQFLKEVERFKDYVTFRHRSIDPGTMYWNPEADDVPPGTEECMKRAGRQGSVAHTAIADAEEVIHLVRHATSNEYRWNTALELLNKSMADSGVHVEGNAGQGIVVVVEDRASRSNFANLDLLQLIKQGAFDKDRIYQQSVRSRDDGGDRMPHRSPAKLGL